MTPADLTGLGTVHVVGIGGAGMSGIARILVARGITVTGSGTTYTVAVTGMASGEMVTAKIPANVAISTSSGFGNLASRNGFDNHVTYLP